MPYTPKAERTIRAVAHGWKPDDPDIKMTQKTAKKLSKHIRRKRGSKR